MSFKTSFIKIIENLETTDKWKEDALRFIRKNTTTLKKNPSNYNNNSNKMINYLCITIFSLAKQLYGDSNTNYHKGAELGYEIKKEDFQMRGISSEQLIRSRVITCLDDSNKFAIFISSNCKTWENLFYDLCHECIHLLNPVKDIGAINVQRLDEGVAVRFAEYMYKKYILSYCNTLPYNSPISHEGSQYYVAYHLTSRIPDKKLKEVRSIFGSFWSIPDKEKFMSIVGNYITDKEANYLLAKFDYNQP